MTKVAWVTDSTAFLDEELLHHPDVYQVPMTIILDGEEFTDGIDLTTEELYERLKTLKTPPKTSQPSIGAFQNVFEKLKEDYDVIVAVLISSKLSGTVSSCEQASQLVDIPVITIDSKILTYPLTKIIKTGIHSLESGMELEEVKEKIEKLRDTNELYVLIGSLEQLHRSGRMSGLKFFLGSMLNVKPIISIENGELNIKEKARSERKAKDKIVQQLRKANEIQPLKEAFLLYGLHDTEAIAWQKELMQEFPEIEFSSCSIGATIGVHAGENTLGISWFNGLD
ncbi:DegV family protein [Bacillus sp. FJAT-29790]|uniref:DegV family protein n=1 Tax=Bacillus sp. FJAT-29790 TaxID=1895002 RepID=UPI001C221775|nr:DegV family protein [Bacillus sp. FJAT-29790]MBU8878972.1 DegV family protein [Bacillus sp. FJAT-29790]